MRTETIVIAQVTGRCRWCQCTERNACPGPFGEGCSWANAARTLCSECVEVDAYIRTPAGRRALARLVQPVLAAAAAERRQVSRLTRRRR